MPLKIRGNLLLSTVVTVPEIERVSATEDPILALAKPQSEFEYANIESFCNVVLLRDIAYIILNLLVGRAFQQKKVLLTRTSRSSLYGCVRYGSPTRPVGRSVTERAGKTSVFCPRESRFLHEEERERRERG